MRKEIYLERRIAIAELNNKWFKALILKIKLWIIRRNKYGIVDKKSR